MVIINVVLNSPVYEIIPHFNRLFQIKLTGTKESKQINLIELLDRDFFDWMNMRPEFRQDLKLLFGTIARESEVNCKVTLSIIFVFISSYHRTKTSSIFYDVIIW